MVITKHSKQRIVERTNGVSTFAEAKRLAKQARISIPDRYIEEMEAIDNGLDN